MTERRLIGHMVTRNEATRWLKQTLPWLNAITDTTVVYDDRSDDGTYAYVLGQGVTATSRPGNSVSFLQDESRFRGDGWAFMEDVARPGPGDWILCVDADEFVVTEHRDPLGALAARLAILRAVEEAERQGRGAVTLPVIEVFGFRSGTPMVRRDGYWGGITACRLTKWRPHASFSPRVEGGGSIPSGWLDHHLPTEDLHLMHLGYARPEDRQARYERYRSGRGHNMVHIDSILQCPTLAPWDGMSVFSTDVDR